MSDFVEVDVRGLSCPEPVLMVMDAMDEHPGKQIRVLGDEAHTRTNIERTLEYHGKEGQPRCWKTAVSPLPLKRDVALE